jgi:hypothetical protein
MHESAAHGREYFTVKSGNFSLEMIEQNSIIAWPSMESGDAAATRKASGLNSSPLEGIAMQPKLIITFDRYSEADFQAKAGSILAALTNNPHFPEPWPTLAPSLAELNAAFTAYRDAYHASQTRDTLKIRQRDTARQLLTDLLKHLATYLELVARNDSDILATTGYDLRHEILRGNSNDPLPAPGELRVIHGPQSGSLDVRVARLPGARSYEVQITQGDPKQEDLWKHARTSTTSSHILLEDLLPAQTYWVRVRGIAASGNGVWTDPVSVIVV